MVLLFFRLESLRVTLPGGGEVEVALPSALAAALVFVAVVLIGKLLYDTLFYDHYRP